MVSHPIPEGDDFSSPLRRRSENNDAQFATELMLYYKKTNCPESRDWLMTYYMRTFVRNAARRIASGLPKSIDAEDLEQVGFFGLVECIEKFDPNRQFKFETFARQRVEGAMRDELRRIDPASRLARQRTKLIAKGIDLFRSQHGRSPTDEELQAILHLDQKEFSAVMRDVHVPSTLPFHPCEDDEGDGLMVSSIELKNSGHAEIDRKDLQEWLCMQLNTYDRLIVSLTYIEGLTMLEIGHSLGYSESRVSQRLKHIHAILKNKLVESIDVSWLMAG